MYWSYTANESDVAMNEAFEAAVSRPSSFEQSALGTTTGEKCKKGLEKGWTVESTGIYPH